MCYNNDPPPMSSEDHTLPLLVHSSLYVLELVGGRYYIGISMNLSHRLAQHFSNRGSQFTRTYEPVRVAEVIYKANLNTERQKTLEYIQRFGFNFSDGSPRVRGAGYSGLNARPPAPALLLAATGSSSAGSGSSASRPHESSQNTAIDTDCKPMPLRQAAPTYLQVAGQHSPH